MGQKQKPSERERGPSPTEMHSKRQRAMLDVAAEGRRGGAPGVLWLQVAPRGLRSQLFLQLFACFFLQECRQCFWNKKLNCYVLQNFIF